MNSAMNPMARAPRPLRAFAVLLLGCVFGLPAAARADAAAAPGAEDYSSAERALFLAAHLRGLPAPARLDYRFRRSGALEAGFDDAVHVHLDARADGRCCQARGEFLSGARQLRLPEIDDARANPVLLYFLEHDVRDMQRLTRGQPAHFRRRIRVAIQRTAQVREAQFIYRGKAVAGQEIRITPYADDPLRGRFERFADKEYVFLLSAAVPGGVYGIRTRIPAGAGDALLADELYLAGATVPAPTASPTAFLSAEPNR